jgi:hypothetical protein
LVKRTYIPIRDDSDLYREPTLDDILSDSIVVAVMRADGVDRRELNVMLAGVARAVRAAEDAAWERRRGPERALVHVCDAV